MNTKSLGVWAIVLGSLGIVVGCEEMLAAFFSGASWDHGTGTSRALEEAKSGVLLVGLALTAMSVWLLVVGILLAINRGAALAKVWAVFGIVIAIGLVLDAVSNRALVAELGESRRYPYPGYLADLGGAKIPVLALLAAFPIALLVFVPKRRPLEAAL